VSTDLPLRAGDAGDAVRDVQRRLAGQGVDVSADEPGRYGPATEAAVRAFQERRGLRTDGVCGRQTWSSLVEASFHLGDRLLYLKAPMVRGDDVDELQRLLGALGFDAGRVDGILGPRTAEALEAFQRNSGLTIDGICGPDTVDALRRVGRPPHNAPTVAVVREVERLRDSSRELDGRRFCVGETGGLASLADAVGRGLTDAGAVIAVLHHPDGSVQAAQANAFNAEAYLGLALRDAAGSAASFYATEAFESLGGRRLAELVLAELTAVAAPAAGRATGMRLPVLRETRMPAIVCEFGPPAVAVERAAELARSLTAAFTRWVHDPVSPG
jgi:N-acetylmuramoyl-L-alanine amidase